MTEGHISESSRRAGFSKFVFLQGVVNLLADPEMIGVRFAVDEIRPVEIASESPLAAGQ